MKLKNVLHALQQMTPEQLENPALIYHPFYRRFFELQAYDAMKTISPDKAEDERVVFITTDRPVQ